MLPREAKPSDHQADLRSDDPATDLPTGRSKYGLARLPLDAQDLGQSEGTD